MSEATRQAEILSAMVIGFLSPVYSSPQPNGRTINGFLEADYDRVMAGYACGDCCAVFDSYMGEFCPVCGLSRELGSKPEADPDQWQAFLDEHLNGSGRTETRSAPEFVRDVAADRDIEQTTLSSIRDGSAWRKHRKG